jgi:hypothetical protein
MQQAMQRDVQQPMANGGREYAARPAGSDLDRRSILLVMWQRALACFKLRKGG